MKNKLLNFTICQIFVVIGMSVLCVKCEKQQKLAAAENVTQYDRSFEKVLSRRKRFLLWRPGSNVLLTASLVKPLVFPRPGGHNLILEWDIFYPLPNTWHRPAAPTHAPAPPPAPSPPPFSSGEIGPYNEDHQGEIWLPPGGWSSDTDVIKTLSDIPIDKRRNWDVPQPLRRNDLNGNFPLNPPVSSYQNPFYSAEPWQQAPQTSPEVNFNQQYYQSPSSSYSEKNFIADNKQRGGNLIPRGRSLEHHDNVDNDGQGWVESIDPNWKHYHAHRDRRDLFDRILSSSPLHGKWCERLADVDVSSLSDELRSSIDVKSCLLRTICETQHFLHPPGYSLLQDALRLIFTVPIKDDMDDDYSNAMRGNDQDCVRIFEEKCPMSVLAFILQAKY